jgi:hypothetical protein
MASVGECQGQLHHLRIGGDVADQPSAAGPWLNGLIRKQQQAMLVEQTGDVIFRGGLLSRYPRADPVQRGAEFRKRCRAQLQVQVMPTGSCPRSCTTKQCTNLQVVTRHRCRGASPASAGGSEASHEQ